jgi:hypothetical protein
LQKDSRGRGGDFRAHRSANEEAAAEQHEPHQRSAVTLLPIAADARKAGREHLSDQRNALGRVLLGAQQQNGKHNEAAAWTGAEEPGSNAAEESDCDAIEETIGVQLLHAAIYSDDRLSLVARRDRYL